MRVATCPQFLRPSATSSFSSSSSSGRQWPLTSPGASTFVHRCRHCVWFRPGTSSAIDFQLRSPWRFTASRSRSSCRGITQSTSPNAIDRVKPFTQAHLFVRPPLRDGLVLGFHDLSTATGMRRPTAEKVRNVKTLTSCCFCRGTPLISVNTRLVPVGVLDSLPPSAPTVSFLHQ